MNHSTGGWLDRKRFTSMMIKDDPVVEIKTPKRRARDAVAESITDDNVIETI